MKNQYIVVILSIVTFFTGCKPLPEPVPLETKGDAIVSIQLRGSDIIEPNKMHLIAKGSGMEEVAVEVTKDENGLWQHLFSDLPTGDDRSFHVVAFDIHDIPHYQGKVENVSIHAGKTAQVVIVLQSEEDVDPQPNTAPQILSLVASNRYIKPNETAELRVEGFDKEDDAITYTWSSKTGTFDKTDGTNVKWTAPEKVGDHILHITLKDPHGAHTSMKILISSKVGVSFNKPPVITDLLVTPKSFRTGQDVHPYLEAHDPEGGKLTYSWSDSGGECKGRFNDSSLKRAIWTAPATLPSSGKCTLYVTIKDEDGAETSGSVDMTTDSSEGPNQNPQIVKTGQSFPAAFQGQELLFSLEVKDPEEQPITFKWHSTCGTPGTIHQKKNLGTFRWTAPNGNFLCAVTVTASDNSGGSITHSFVVPERFETKSLTHLGGSKNDFARDMAVDGKGNVYILGLFEGSALFGSFELKSVGTRDFFVAKMDAKGTVLWSQRIGGAGSEFVSNMLVTKNGDVYLAGHFSQNLTMQSQEKLAKGSTDAFVLKLNANGLLEWMQTAGGSGKDTATALTTDSKGNLHIAGTFASTATFGNTSLKNGSWVTAGYRAALTTSGQWLQSSRWELNTREPAAQQVSFYPEAMVLDSSDNVYMAGTFHYKRKVIKRDEITCTLQPELCLDAFERSFLVKMNTQGKEAWFKFTSEESSSSSAQKSTPSLAINQEGNILFGIQFHNGQSDYLMKLTPAGVQHWRKEHTVEKLILGTNNQFYAIADGFIKKMDVYGSLIKAFHSTGFVQSCALGANGTLFTTTNVSDAHAKEKGMTLSGMQDVVIETIQDPS